jgi:hypothetical protein
VDGVFHQLGIVMDLRTHRLLSIAQRAQDDGVPWAYAVAAARHGVATNQ